MYLQGSYVSSDGILLSDSISDEGEFPCRKAKRSNLNYNRMVTGEAMKPHLSYRDKNILT